eukprot:PLAT5168.1.p1 GENE.PLAT5168.1~~PLAT5168.1.p1  ORF type:complete len:465 (-),score=150.62 PLAT5168.1:91-1377(-)
MAAEAAVSVEDGGAELFLRALELACSGGERRREMLASCLSSFMLRGLLTKDALRAGVARVLARLDDLALDAPAAPALLAYLLAQLFLTSRMEVEDIGGDAVLPEVVRDELARLLAGRQPVAQLHDAIKAVVREFLTSGELDEALRSIYELHSPHYGHQVVKTLVLQAMDGRALHRRYAADLLQQLSAFSILPADQLIDGFLRLLYSLSEVKLDVPAASTLLHKFILRASFDGYLPATFCADVPAYLRDDGSDVAALLDSLSTELPLSSDDASHVERMRTLWGAGDGRPLPELREAVKTVVTDYLHNGDVAAAVLACRALESPFFHHELVKCMCAQALAAGEPALPPTAALLAALRSEGVLLDASISQGVLRIYRQLEDMQRDLPLAPALLVSLLQHVSKAGVPAVLFTTGVPDDVADGVVEDVLARLS